MNLNTIIQKTLSEERNKKYGDLAAGFRNTPLVKYLGPVPNGNTILIKNEYGNERTHYDRVFGPLFKNLEVKGIIIEGSEVFETTSGSAGASFVRIGKELGFECYVGMPAGGERARETAILEHLISDKHLTLTDAEQYIDAFPKFILDSIKKGRTWLSHSQDRDELTKKTISNETTLYALGEIGREIIGKHPNPDYVVLATGNGSSSLAIARELPNSCKIISYESVQAGVVEEKLYPGRYQKRFGIKPGVSARHELPGTIYNSGIFFPHLEEFIDENFICENVLVTGQKMTNIAREYYRINNIIFPEEEFAKLPCWDSESIVREDLGKSSLAGISVALQIAEKVKGKTIFTLGYDGNSKYD